jgi:mono/diheme cytochrome c family protein
MRRKFLIWCAFILAAATAILGGLYAKVVPGLSSARTEPLAAETILATWLLHQSVPFESKMSRNPAPDPSDIAAGKDLYRQKCETCHAYDGGGKTPIGSNEFPRVPTLRSPAIAATSDGELFYHIRNGIRNTGMPAWDLPDRQIWQLVSFIRYLPEVAAMSPEAAAAPTTMPSDRGRYVGSIACKGCHEEVYARWSKTRMANVVRDPREHPDAIIPDLSKPNPVFSFTKDDVALVYGSRWKQRYFKKVGDDYFPLPVQWDVFHQTWSRYFVPNTGDWWTAFYPPDNFQRPTGPLCDGCHSVNYDINTKTVTEWNVGCERCHGPGEAHGKKPVRDNILNPVRFNYVDASDTCIQCHSQGQPLTKPIQGKYYDWPVGFDVGKHLKDYWKLEEHKLGDLTFTHFPNGTAHKNRMQGNDFVQSLMYARGVTCSSCHDPMAARTLPWCANPATPCVWIATARMRRPDHTPRQSRRIRIIKPVAPATNALPVICRRSLRRSGTRTSEAIPSISSRQAIPNRLRFQMPAMNATRTNPSSGRKPRWSHGPIARPGARGRHHGNSA